MTWFSGVHFRRETEFESLLNSLNESHTEAEASDEDIYEAVMDAIEARDNVHQQNTMLLETHLTHLRSASRNLKEYLKKKYLSLKCP